MGQPQGEGLKVGFNSSLRLEFHGSKVTSDAGLLAYRELDGVLELFDLVSKDLSDVRTGRNVQHALKTLLRQSVYSRLAGYEDANDATLMSKDPAMRAITRKKKVGKNAARAKGVVHFYNGRGTAEQWIKEGKYALNWTRISCKNFVSNQVILGLFVLAYNLGNFLRRLVLPREIKHWSLRTLLTKLIKIGAKVIRHSRYVTFQMAGVAVSRKIFAEILLRIERLRCCTA